MTTTTPALRLILGGPGTGKTTRLLELMAEELTRGLSPREVAFVTFTKVAATEARQRAAAQFGVTEDELPWFRTLHSVAYQQQGLSKDDIMSATDWHHLSDLTGEELHAVRAPLMEWATGNGAARSAGDLIVQMMDLAATTDQSLEQVYHQHNELRVTWSRTQRVVAAIQHYKQQEERWDFNDMLVRYAADGAPVESVRVVFIDEAQDLTPVQWRVVERAFGHVERMYVGGDDDQAIYWWAGADVERFLALKAIPEVLPLSHRLSRPVHQLATTIAQRISARYAKHFLPAAHDGTVAWHRSMEQLPLHDSGSWFVLARNNYLLRSLETQVRLHGVPYTTRKGNAVVQEHVQAMLLWERLRTGKQVDCSAKEFRVVAKALGRTLPQMRELQRYTVLDLVNHESDLLLVPWYEALHAIPQHTRMFYLACLRRGESLVKPPRVHLDTMHGVKGAEADHVVLCTDMSRTTFTNYLAAPDTEHRTFYVGATRARQSLHLLLPQTPRHYPVPA